MARWESRLNTHSVFFKREGEVVQESVDQWGRLLAPIKKQESAESIDV